MGSNSLAVSNDSPLNGLKFGERIYIENGGGGSGSSSKVPKQPPRCQVEGCSVDLSGAKAYYCRHKVCGMHSKAPKVIVRGLEQRFCQQCSRFHQLPEFDQGKRSCRRRLAGHNERRRKPTPRSLSSIEWLSSSFHDDNSSRLRFRGFLMDFTSPRLPGPTTTASHQWQGGAHFSVPEISAWDSSCALSLLSTQPQGSALTGYRSPATSITTTTISSNSSLNRAPMVQSVISSGYKTSSWGFKGHEVVEPDQFSGELELALQGKRQCMELDHVVNWSL